MNVLHSIDPRRLHIKEIAKIVDDIAIIDLPWVQNDGCILFPRSSSGKCLRLSIGTGQGLRWFAVGCRNVNTIIGSKAPVPDRFGLLRYVLNDIVNLDRLVRVEALLV